MSRTVISETAALELLADVFAEPVANLSPATSRSNVSGWDSMGALMFMAALDEQFGVELTAEESQQMGTVADALSFMRQRGIISG